MSAGSNLEDLRFLSCGEVAELLGVSKATVYRIRRGDEHFPRAFVIWHMLRFRSDDLEAWIDRQDRTLLKPKTIQ